MATRAHTVNSGNNLSNETEKEKCRGGLRIYRNTSYEESVLIKCKSCYPPVVRPSKCL